jgi:hypothetical protein
MKCSLCEDSGWVCETHPDRPWDHAETCRGAGAPWRAIDDRFVAVPELTRSVGIKLNARVLLRRSFQLLKLSQSCDLARHHVPPPGHA